MRIRCGFVSNSSSSSFLIYGVRVDSFSIEKLLSSLDIEAAKQKWAVWYAALQEKYKEARPDWYPDTTWEEWLEEGIEGDPVYLLEYQLSEFFVDLNLSGVTVENPWGESLYLGLNPRGMDDDETMGEFKARAKKTISPMVEEDAKFSWQQEAWRDG